MKLADVPESLRPMYLRAMSGRSRQAAVRVNCLMCVGWNSAEVDRCTATSCPLYPYRSRNAVTDALEGHDEAHVERTESIESPETCSESAPAI